MTMKHPYIFSDLLVSDFQIFITKVLSGNEINYSVGNLYLAMYYMSELLRD